MSQKEDEARRKFIKASVEAKLDFNFQKKPLKHLAKERR